MKSGCLLTSFTRSSFTAHFVPGLMTGKTCWLKLRQLLLMHGQLMKRQKKKLNQERNKKTYAKSSTKR